MEKKNDGKDLMVFDEESFQKYIIKKVNIFLKTIVKSGEFDFNDATYRDMYIHTLDYTTKITNTIISENKLNKNGKTFSKS